VARKVCLLRRKIKDGEENQKWFYKESDQSLTNAVNPDYKLDVHNGWVYLANTKATGEIDADFPKTAGSKWFYDNKSKGLTTDIDGVKSQIAFFGNPQKWGWAEAGPSELIKDKQTAQFKIEYCYNGLG